MPKIKQYSVRTSHAVLNVQESIPSSTSLPAILLIHGNSFCLKVWKHIFNSPLAETHRIIAFDLPGHGSSEDAFEPQKSYNQPAYAEAAVELLQELKVEKVIVVGWSLGGHIAIEMIPRFPELQGIMIMGTPPVASGELDQAFTFGPGGAQASFAARDELTAEDLQNFAHGCADAPYEDWMLECVTRTDGKARKIMFSTFNEHLKKFDQKQIMANTTVPVAVVNGKDEPFINLDYVRRVNYSSLWRDGCIEME